MIFKGWVIFFLLWLNSKRYNKCEESNPLAFHFISMTIAHLCLLPCKYRTWTLESCLKRTPEALFCGRSSESSNIRGNNIHLFPMEVTRSRCEIWSHIAEYNVIVWDIKSHCNIVREKSPFIYFYLLSITLKKHSEIVSQFLTITKKWQVTHWITYWIPIVILFLL